MNLLDEFFFRVTIYGFVVTWFMPTSIHFLAVSAKASAVNAIIIGSYCTSCLILNVASNPKENSQKILIILFF